MSQVEIAEAEADFCGLIQRARNGEEVLVAQEGLVLVQLVPVERERPRLYPVQLGRLEGRFKVPDDFDAPLPEDILDLFEGKA